MCPQRSGGRGAPRNAGRVPWPRTASWGSFNLVAETPSRCRCTQPFRAKRPRLACGFGLVRSRTATASSRTCRAGARSHRGTPSGRGAARRSRGSPPRLACAEVDLSQERLRMATGHPALDRAPPRSASWPSRGPGRIRSMGNAPASWRATFSMTLRPRRCSPLTTVGGGVCRSQTMPNHDRNVRA